MLAMIAMDRVNVVNADEMDAHTFYRHWNKRHMPLAGVDWFHDHPEDSGATISLRTYHERVHSIEQHLIRDGHVHDAD